jgi:hypothetical protein
MGRPHIARGPVADDDTRACAHRVTIKRMSGPGQLVIEFLLRWNVDLKNRSFKMVDQKIFKQSAAYI